MSSQVELHIDLVLDTVYSAGERLDSVFSLLPEVYVRRALMFSSPSAVFLSQYVIIRRWLNGVWPASSFNLTDLFRLKTQCNLSSLYLSDTGAFHLTAVTGWVNWEPFGLFFFLPELQVNEIATVICLWFWLRKVITRIQMYARQFPSNSHSQQLFCSGISSLAKCIRTWK